MQSSAHAQTVMPDYWHSRRTPRTGRFACGYPHKPPWSYQLVIGNSVTRACAHAVCLAGDPVEEYARAYGQRFHRRHDRLNRVLGWRSRAARLVSSAGDVPVFLVTMQGNFVATAASRPPGAAAPVGSYLSIVVDARTFQVLDSGLSPSPPPVSPASLGPVTYRHAQPVQPPFAAVGRRRWQSAGGRLVSRAGQVTGRGRGCPPHGSPGPRDATDQR